MLYQKQNLPCFEWQLLFAELLFPLSQAWPMPDIKSDLNDMK